VARSGLGRYPVQGRQAVGREYDEIKNHRSRAHILSAVSMSRRSSPSASAITNASTEAATPRA
jgi:hypothetical protein